MTVTTAVTSRAALADPNRARRVVVKIGSSSLTDPGGRLDVRKLNALVEVLAARRASGGQVVLVSSGAIASALGVLGLTARPRPEEHTSELQSRGHVVCRTLLY